MELEFGKKVYSVQESYWIMYHGLRTMKYMVKARSAQELSAAFIERLMLTVTEVNGCDVCSYAHAKMALESGMSNEEIQRILAGNTEGVPAGEAVAILFAQHYADTKGNPTPESWQRLVETYGVSRANGILGSIRTIMVGNAYGIAASALLRRLRGKPVKKSSFLYEVSMILTGVLLAPIAAIHALISGAFKVPVIGWPPDVLPEAT